MNIGNISPRQKNTLFIIFLLFLVFAGWNVFAMIQRTGTIALTLEKIPSDSTVLLEGSEIRSSEVRLKPGVYTFEVVKDGFYSRSITHIITPETPELPLILTPNNEETLNAMQAEGSYHGISSGESIDLVLGILPIKDFMYTIDIPSWENISPDEPITLVITVPTGYRNVPIERLKTIGVDPSDYRYSFNFESPF